MTAEFARGDGVPGSDRPASSTGVSQRITPVPTPTPTAIHPIPVRINRGKDRISDLVSGCRPQAGDSLAWPFAASIIASPSPAVSAVVTSEA